MTKNWSYAEAKALISIYSNRKEEYFKTRNKKHFWENILTDLESLNVLVSPTTITNVEVKWRSLYRAYKNSKDRGTGTTATKFLYMEDMDEIFHNNPSIATPLAVDVGIVKLPVPAPMVVKKKVTNSEVAEGQNCVLNKKKSVVHKTVCKDDYFKKKLELLKEKNEILKKKNEITYKYCVGKEKNRQKKIELMTAFIENFKQNK